MAGAWWIWILFGGAAMVAVWSIVWALTSSPLQRRLFFLFVALSWLPVLGSLALDWRQTQRVQQLVDSPGLHQALESSLELARGTLEGHRHVAADRLNQLVEAWPELPTDPALSWAWLGPEPKFGGPFGRELVDLGPRESRIDRHGQQLLVVSQTLPDATSLRLLWPLEASLGQHLTAIEAGSSGLRQMRLFYARFIRLDILVWAAVVSVAVLLASLFLSRRLARRIAGPIGQLSAATERVAAGDLDQRVETDAVDEVKQLVAAFNRMTSDLQTSKEELRRSERIAAWQGVARRLAHEIKNPLTPIHLSIHRVRAKTEDPVVLECLDTMLEETENLRRLAEEFSTYGRMPTPAPSRVDLATVVDSIVELYLKRSQVEIDRVGVDQAATVWADEGQVRQVLANLIKNAHEAMGDRGRLRLVATHDAESVQLEVQDSGPGLGDHLERAFDADFSTKSSGTGLGLAISRQIVEDQGGSLVAYDRDDGATFVLTLPRAKDQ